MPSNQSALCPQCSARVNLPAGVDLWDMVTCRACGTDLEVVSLSPLELDYWNDPDEELEYDDYDDEEID